MKLFEVVLELKDEIYDKMKQGDKPFIVNIEFNVVANSMEEAHQEIKSFNNTNFDFNISQEVYEFIK